MSIFMRETTWKMIGLNIFIMIVTVLALYVILFVVISCCAKKETEQSLEESNEVICNPTPDHPTHEPRPLPTYEELKPSPQFEEMLQSPPSYWSLFPDILRQASHYLDNKSDMI